MDGVLDRYRDPSQLVQDKVIDHLDRHCRAFIELSPFATLSTASADGWPDVSPRGGDPGFVKVLDEHRLALPDRPGNNRVDSLHNVAGNPRASRRRCGSSARPPWPRRRSWRSTSPSSAAPPGRCSW
jgi:predicted pyridoxine 5'-phosphate oxidase superfamily flavin-nucleotide-binding protein